MLQLIKNTPIIIPVPDLPLLDTPEGFSLWESSIKPVTKAIVSGPQKIIVTIPDDRPIYTPSRNSRTIHGSFFAGLFQNILLALRATHFPQLEYQAARENIRMVVGHERKDWSREDVAGLIFDKPWKTYAELEELFWQKVSLGLQHANGTITPANIGPGREHLNEIDSENGAKLFQWVYQVARGLDAVFGVDLKFDMTHRVDIKQSIAAANLVPQ